MTVKEIGLYQRLAELESRCIQSKNINLRDLDSFMASLGRRVSGKPDVLSSIFYSDAVQHLKSDRPVGSSHLHENGFLKLGIYKSALTGIKVRVHIWPKGEADRSSEIHDHRWSFASLVCKGAVRFENFRKDVREESPESSSYLEYQLSDADSSGQKLVSATGRVRLLPVSTYEVAEYSTHALSHDVPHCATALSSESTVVTLVLTAPAARPYSNTYRTDKNLSERTAARTYLSKSDAISYLAALACGRGREL